MRIPRELRIGDGEWRVKFCRLIDPGTHYSNEIQGDCDPSEKVIRIKTNQSPHTRLETFLHEILHAFEFEYEFELGHPLIEKLEVALGAFLRDNFPGWR